MKCLAVAVAVGVLLGLARGASAAEWDKTKETWYLASGPGGAKL